MIEKYLFKPSDVIAGLLQMLPKSALQFWRSGILDHCGQALFLTSFCSQSYV